METMTIGELKAQFSAVLEKVKAGETIVIAYGKKKEKIAAIVPFEQIKPRREHRLGVLRGIAQYRISSNFKISDEELLSS